MVIHLDFNALRRTQLHEYLVRFVMGGLITAATGWLAGHFGPILGGLFLAFPAIFPASATLLEKHELRKKRRAGIPFTLRGRLAAALDARGAVMGTIGGVAFAVVAWKLLPHGHPLAAMAIALAAWFAVSSLFWYVRKHHPWARPQRMPRP